ncbi:unnamed protein product [Arctogadus glacialis]
MTKTETTRLGVMCGSWMGICTTGSAEVCRDSPDTSNSLALFVVDMSRALEHHGVFAEVGKVSCETTWTS